MISVVKDFVTFHCLVMPNPDMATNGAQGLNMIVEPPLKSYFLKSPGISLFTVYLFNVFVFGYIVYGLERLDGTCMLYRDVTWIIVVSLTNLGFGDYVPTHWLSRQRLAKKQRTNCFSVNLCIQVNCCRSISFWNFSNCAYSRCTQRSTSYSS